MPYVPGGAQLSLEEELGRPIGGEDGIPEPQDYRLYVLWWPGSLTSGGAVMAAGVLTEKVQILYATTPLPQPIMEQRSETVGLTGRGVGTGPAGSGKRRRDDDFGEIDGEDGEEEAAPPQTS